MGTLHIVNKSGRRDELVLQWTKHRVDTLARRSTAMGKVVTKGLLSVEKIKQKMDDWIKGQTACLQTTYYAMHPTVPLGSATYIH